MVPVGRWRLLRSSHVRVRREVPKVPKVPKGLEGSRLVRLYQRDPRAPVVPVGRWRLLRSSHVRVRREVPKVPKGLEGSRLVRLYQRGPEASKITVGTEAPGPTVSRQGSPRGFKVPKDKAGSDSIACTREVQKGPRCLNGPIFLCVNDSKGQ